MELTWFGRYRDIIAALVYHTNCVNRTANIRDDIGSGVMLTAQEWQTLEVIIEHDDENLIMSDISKLLGIPLSTLSKISKQILSQGLVERYRIDGNRKSIILKPSKKGYLLYQEHCEAVTKPLFQKIFNKLEPLSDEQLKIISDAIKALNAEMEEDNGHQLVKLE